MTVTNEQTGIELAVTGSLVAVIPIDGARRELWFQTDNGSLLMVKVHMTDRRQDGDVTILAPDENREKFAFAFD